MPATCTRCGTDPGAAARFCPACGLALSAPAPQTGRSPLGVLAAGGFVLAVGPLTLGLLTGQPGWLEAYQLFVLVGYVLSAMAWVAWRSTGGDAVLGSHPEWERVFRRLALGQAALALASLAGLLQIIDEHIRGAALVAYAALVIGAGISGFGWSLFARRAAQAGRS